MKIGFTGTRYGGTKEQKETLRELLYLAKPTTADHGDCVGADDDFHKTVREVCPTTEIHGRPGPGTDLRAFNEFDVEHPVKTHFARNRDIVDGKDMIYAIPNSFEEQERGGTWYTIRYARKKHVPCTIIWPDGSTTLEENNPPGK